MAEIFNPTDFVNKIGEKLVFEFDHASSAGTPGLVGSARENPARKQLEKLLPAQLSTGSGILIDSFGGKSNQADIVFFERDLCPVYSINDTPEATYFPIEGVAAVGEVKSVVDKGTLFDALQKIRAAKLLKRFSEKSQTLPGSAPAANFRLYGQIGEYAATQETEYDQEKKFADQIFAFIICKSFRNSADAILENLVEFGKMYEFATMPNLIISLGDGLVQHIDSSSMSLQRSTSNADAFAFMPDKARAFAFLVRALRLHARDGRTVPLSSYDRYMSSLSGTWNVTAMRSYRS